MGEQKRKMSIQPSVTVAVLLMALAVGLIVLMAMGLLLSALVVRGAAGLGVMNGGALAALFLASLIGGVFACRKLRTMPLIWGLCVGAEISLTCVAAGALAYGGVIPAAMLARVAAALIGGVAAGVLSAVLKK